MAQTGVSAPETMDFAVMSSRGSTDGVAFDANGNLGVTPASQPASDLKTVEAA